MSQADPPNNCVDILGEARDHKAGIAARGIPGDPVRLQNRHRPATPGKLAGGGEASQTGTHHADLDVEIGRQWRPFRRLHHSLRVPARRVGRPLGRVHVVSRGIPAAPLFMNAMVAHIPEKWAPVFRQGYAPLKNLEHVPIPQERNMF